MDKSLTTTYNNGSLTTTSRNEIGDQWLYVASKGLDLLKFIVEADFQTTRMEHDRRLATEQMKYDYLKQVDVPGKAFSEREQALARVYSILEKASEADDRELVKASLETIGKIVSNGASQKNDRIEYLPNC